MSRFALRIASLLLLSTPAEAYGPEEYLALFAAEAPAQFKNDPQRIATIAVAAARAEKKLIGSFPHPKMLGPALATTILSESGLKSGIHAGTVRGKAGEICLGQIHPTNKIWERWAPSFESLGGAGIVWTEFCLLSVADTLASSLRYCAKRRYFTNWAPAMFTMYHYGGKCWLSPHGFPRARRMARIAATRWVPTLDQLQLIIGVLAANPLEPEVRYEPVNP